LVQRPNRLAAAIFGRLPLAAAVPAGLQVLETEAFGLEFHAGKNPIALHVDDVESARAELESRGVSFKGETLDSGVCHMAFFDDPDGNALMLHHRYAPREP
jgi:catechol 2,3-dioxygenase-like lactoylglutathione lyase family enzyme